MGKYESLAKGIVKNVGGKGNIVSLRHCVTRLRFQLKDESIANTDVLKNMDGVVTVMQAGGEYQVVIGNNVPDVYKDVVEVAQLPSETEGSEKVHGGKAIIGFLQAMMMPSIGILCASGIIKGLLSLITFFGWMSNTDGLYLLFNAAGDAMLFFFPVIIGYNSFKKLGGNPFLGMILGAGLMYPAIQGVDLNVFGMTINATYSSQVIPAALLAVVGAPMEKGLNKIIPDVVKNFLVPAIVLLVCVPLGFCIIGPIATKFGDIMALIINTVYGFSPLLASVLLAFFWQILVMFGVHGIVLMPMFILLMQGTPQPLMAANGVCSFVTTGAVIAIWLKTKDKKLKAVAFPSWISGIFGVTEPAIYGVTLLQGRQFIYTCIGSAVAGGLSALFGCVVYSFAGMGIFSVMGAVDPSNPGQSLLNRAIVFAIATVIGFVVAFLTFKDDEAPQPLLSSGTKKTVVKKEVIISPLTGNIVSLNEVKDEAFSGGLLGKGIAIEPTDNKVNSPCDGTVMTLSPTLHAIGIVSDQGAEVLIHLGMDTVKMEGEGFHAYVKQGEKVKKGQKLLTMDLDAIKKHGYSAITPIIITNTKDYLDIVPTDQKSIKTGNDLMTLII